MTSPLREADIRPTDVHAEYIRLSAADGERLFGDRDGWVHRTCPGCGGDRPLPEFNKQGFRLVRCAACDSLYVDPCPAAADLVPLYADSPSARYWAEVFFPSVAEARRGHVFRPRAQRIVDLMVEAGRALATVIDVGAGAGMFLEELGRLRPDLGLRAVEPGPPLAVQCRDKGFETYQGFGEAAALEPGWAGTADLVVCFEVIEHTTDPLAFVGALAALARPGGTVLFSGLSGDGFDIRVLGAKSNAVTPPHHLTFLSVGGTRRLLDRAGLEGIRVFTPGLLDVNIVVNKLRDDGAVTDPFLRHLLLGPDEQARQAFQKFLQDNALSSHMWAMGRLPDRT